MPLSSYHTIEREDLLTRKIVFIAALFTLVSVAAVGQSDWTSRRSSNLPRAVPNLPFSDGVLVGNTLYQWGRIGVDPQSGKVPAELNDEIGNLLGGLKKMLELIHMTRDDLVYVQVFCPDLAMYGRFNVAYRTYFAKDFPARAFIGSGPLLLGAHFEIQGIAVK